MIKTFRYTIGPDTDEVKKQNKRKQWFFNVSAPSVEIDLGLIASDLSSLHPFAVVTVKGRKESYIIVVHRSLMLKANAILRAAEEVSEEGNKFKKFLSSYEKDEFISSNWKAINKGTSYITTFDPKCVTYHKNIFRAIRKMEWPSSVRDKSEVTVTLHSFED